MSTISRRTHMELAAHVDHLARRVYDLEGMVTAQWNTVEAMSLSIQEKLGVSDEEAQAYVGRVKERHRRILAGLAPDPPKWWQWRKRRAEKAAIAEREAAAAAQSPPDGKATTYTTPAETVTREAGAA